ncbi:MAG: Nif3-like dinuclear metal center hexameric protein [Armatimonadetes bacterium]|nr:Nif3-like dinuclear metal center hexameric protein [Armatimonadota bacterium]
MITAGAVAAALAEFAPPVLAESWDNVGLLVGDPAAEVRRVLATLDVTAAVHDEAGRLGAELIVTFHPPIFKPLPRVRADEASSCEVWRAVREGRGLYATHTALDAARPGTSDWLAEALGVRVDGVLRAAERRGDVKLVTFVPAEQVGQVAAALAEGGAGRIGAYAECSFRSTGVGTFRGLAGAHPAVGEAGVLEEVDEVRLEMLVPESRVGGVVQALRAAHPYEEPAFDLYPLRNSGGDVGLGRVGLLPEPEPLGEFAERVRGVLGAGGVSWVGEAARPVRRVAVMGGSGTSLLDDARRAGAEVYVTGDVKHHDALRAQRSGLALVDPGHWATERPVIGATARWLRARMPGLKVFETTVDGDPFTGRRAG